MRFYLRYSFLILATLIFVTGCEPRPKRLKLIPTSGRITIDGEPLAEGMITVWVKDYRAAIGQTDSEGRYSLRTYDPDDGCRPGTHPITISSHVSISEDAVKHLIPEIYNNPETSQLTITIGEPRDNADYDLTWKVDPEHTRPYITK